MNRLNFTPIDKAFLLGSSQIKDTQEEIAQLTKLILDSNQQPKNKKKNSEPPEGPYTNIQQQPYQNYMRTGYPDNQSSVFQKSPQTNELDYNLLKVIGHPKFDDIVKNYVLINHPEWLLKETVYRPAKSNFGSKYSTTVCSNVKNYLFFYITCVLIFLLLSVYLH